MSTPDKVDAPGSDTRSPVIVELGTYSRKRLRLMRKGRGRLMEDLNEVLATLGEDGTLPAGVRPVVVVVKEAPDDPITGWLGQGCP